MQCVTLNHFDITDCLGCLGNNVGFSTPGALKGQLECLRHCVALSSILLLRHRIVVWTSLGCAADFRPHPLSLRLACYGRPRGFCLFATRLTDTQLRRSLSHTHCGIWTDMYLFISRHDLLQRCHVHRLEASNSSSTAVTAGCCCATSCKSRKLLGSQQWLLPSDVSDEGPWGPYTSADSW